MEVKNNTHVSAVASTIFGFWTKWLRQPLFLPRILVGLNCYKIVPFGMFITIVFKVINKFGLSVDM